MATRTQSGRLEYAIARVLTANAPACRAAPPPLAAGARGPVLKLPRSALGDLPSSGAYLPVLQAPSPLHSFWQCQ